MDQADTQGMDIMMTRTTAIRQTDTTVTDHLFHSVSLVVILTTVVSTTTDLEVSESILSTIKISAQICSSTENNISHGAEAEISDQRY
jgi:hypothetical protein